MKKVVFILLILSFFKTEAQNYDLIVTTEGDSIACYIDSISGEKIHFRIMLRNQWFNTNTKLNDVVEYKYDAVDKYSVLFKPGTTYIDKVIQNNVNTETYDLIVTNNGDSIACYIDSITDRYIYFEMKSNNKWIHTCAEKSNIVEYKYDQFSGKVLIFKGESSYILEIKNATKYFDRKLYSNRYLFAPSAFPMKKDLFNYSNITLGLHDLQYGFGNRFSLAFGTTMFFFPVYFMPNYSFPINSNSSFAVGDLFLFSAIDEISFYGNLLYGMYSKGSSENNFSVGLGLWTTPDCEAAAKTISPAINFSAILKTAYNGYFITEEYLFQYNVNQTAHYVSDSEVPNDDFFKENIYSVGYQVFVSLGKIILEIAGNLH